MGSYWPAAVVESDTGGRYFTDDCTNIQANFCQQCTEEDSGKPLLNIAYLEKFMMIQSRMKQEIVVEDENHGSEGPQPAIGEKQNTSANGVANNDATRLKSKPTKHSHISNM